MGHNSHDLMQCKIPFILLFFFGSSWLFVSSILKGCNFSAEELPDILKQSNQSNNVTLLACMGGILFDYESVQLKDFI